MSLRRRSQTILAAHCVLVGLCRPDEHAIERGETDRSARLIAQDKPSHPLHLTEPDVVLGTSGGRLELRRRGERLDSVRAIDVSHVVVYGNGTVTSAAVRAVTESGGTVTWCSWSGWPRAFATPVRKTDARRRIAQHRAHLVGALEICRAFVIGRLRNQRTLLRRLGDPQLSSAGALLRSAIATAGNASDVSSLLGAEGAASRGYFAAFSSMVRRDVGGFSFEGRNRRPPRDPVNALLSFANALLVRDATVAAVSAGLDPYVGLFHRPGFARPALALDLMEEFRPLIADSAVIRAINNGEVSRQDFIVSRTAATLTPSGRRRFIGSYERRVGEEIRHPIFGYRVTYRRCWNCRPACSHRSCWGSFPDTDPGQHAKRIPWPTGRGICSSMTSARIAACAASIALLPPTVRRFSTRCSSATSLTPNG